MSVAVTLAVALGLAAYASWWGRRQTEGELQAVHLLIQSRNLTAVEHALDEGLTIRNEQDTLIGWKYAPLHVAVALPEPADAQLCSCHDRAAG